VAAPGGVEVNEEEIGGAHRRVKVALVQLQHSPVTGDLEFLRLPAAAPRPQKAEEEEEGKQQPLPRDLERLREGVNSSKRTGESVNRRYEIFASLLLPNLANAHKNKLRSSLDVMITPFHS
jgi:hypothetical protein